MSDLIDRQAAIDALDCINGTEEVLRSLPSVQPEIKTEEFVKLTVRNSNGRPYYSIIYLEDGNEFEGYSSYSLDVISDYLKRYFKFAQPEIKKVRCKLCHFADCASPYDGVTERCLYAEGQDGEG